MGGLYYLLVLSSGVRSMPIQLWSDELQEFENASPDPPTTDELEALQRKLDAMAPEERAIVAAYVQRLRGDKPH